MNCVLSLLIFDNFLIVCYRRISLVMLGKRLRRNSDDERGGGGEREGDVREKIYS